MNHADYNPIIHEIATEILEERKLRKSYLIDCLDAGICAKCGAELEIIETNYEDFYTLNVFKCPKCYFIAHNQYIY